MKLDDQYPTCELVRRADVLIRYYEPLVQRVVWRVPPPLGVEREDLAQEARIGLVTAIRAWRPERGAFPAFAEKCVTNQTLLAVKMAKRHKRQLLARAVSLGHSRHDDAAGGESERARARPERVRSGRWLPPCEQ